MIGYMRFPCCACVIISFLCRAAGWGRVGWVVVGWLAAVVWDDKDSEQTYITSTTELIYIIMYHISLG